IRSLYHQIKRGFKEGEGFDVRYWTPSELKRVFTKEIGETRLSIDGFFGLGVQKTDIDLMPIKYRAVVMTSETLKFFPFLFPLADSLYVESNKDHALEKMQEIV